MSNIHLHHAHSLSPEQARGALSELADTLARKLAVETRWDGDALHFGVGALGHTVHGRVEVEDRLIRVEVTLPWMLAVFAEKLKIGVEKQGQILLEKPRA